MTTDYIAAYSAGVEGGWKRCSDLRREGLIEPVYEDGVLQTRTGPAGKQVMVCRITNKGLDLLDELKGR